MLITFSSRSSADILMLEKHALQVLKAMGRDYESLPEQGAISHDNLQESIATLEKNIQLEQQMKEEGEDEDDEKELPHPVQEPVELSRRAFPLLSMMKEALKHEGEHVVWRSGSAW